MTHRSRTQRLLILAASTTLAAAGVLLPTSAFAAAPATPHTDTVATMTAGYGGDSHPGITATTAEWVEATDSPSGITFKLPGKPTVQDITEPGGHPARMHHFQTADGLHAFVIVYDIPGQQVNLDEGLQGFVSGYNEPPGGTITSTKGQETTVDGRPALDARLSGEDGGAVAGETRIIADDAHVVQVVTLGPEADEKALNEMHKQLLANIRIP